MKLCDETNRIYDSYDCAARWHVSDENIADARPHQKRVFYKVRYLGEPASLCAYCPCDNDACTVNISYAKKLPEKVEIKNYCGAHFFIHKGKTEFLIGSVPLFF